MAEINPRRIEAPATDGKVLRSEGGYATWGDTAPSSPTGAAGGVLSGTYPNPGFAQDMATQAELDALSSNLSETIRDVLGATLVAGANVTISVDDNANTVTIASSGGAGSTDPEIVRDTMAAALVAGTGITVTPNDAGDTITIAATGAGGTLDAEGVRDTVAAALVAGAGVVITVDDAGDTITISAPGAGSGGTPTGVKAYRTTNLTIAPDTLTTVPWQATEYDDEPYWASGTPNRLTIARDGRYLLYATLTTAVDGTVPADTRVQAGIYRNGAATPVRGGYTEVSNPSPDNPANAVLAATVDAAEGDYFEVRVIATDDIALDAGGGEYVTFTAQELTGGGAMDPESVRDIVAAALVAGPGIGVAVDDAANTITLTGTTDTETVRDIIGSTVVAGSNITVDVDDGANTVRINATGGVDAEAVRDTVAAALVAGSGISIAVNDAADTITITNTGGGGGGGGDLWALDFTGGTEATEGQDTNRTTGGGYTSHGVDVQVLVPIRLTEVKWDIAKAQTYTLTIGGVQFGSPAVVAADNTADVSFVDEMILTPGIYRFTLTAGASVLWGDTNAAGEFAGSMIRLLEPSYYDATTAAYGASLKVTATPGEWAQGAGGGAGGGHAIEDEATPLAQRTTLAFEGAGVTVTDDAAGDRTVVTIPGGGGGAAGMYASESWHVASAGDSLITLAETPIAKTLKVYKNGLLLRPGAGNDYVHTGTEVLFEVALDAGEVISDHYWTEAPNPGDSTLSASTPASYVGSLLHLDYGYAFSFTLPSGVASGDLMVVAWNAWHGRAVDTANGWLSWYAPNGNSVVCAKFITSETGGSVVSPNPGAAQGYRAAAAMQIVRGVDQADPLYDLAVNGAALDTDLNARRILHFGVQGVGGATPAPLSRGVQSNVAYDGTVGAVTSDESPTPGAYTMTPNNGFGASVALRTA